MGETDEYIDGPSMGWYWGLYRVVWLLSDGSLNSLGHVRQSFLKEVTLILVCIGGGGDLARFKNKIYIYGGRTSPATYYSTLLLFNH